MPLLIMADIIWKICVLNNNYECSNEGNIRNIKTKRILKPWISNGYYYTWLGKINDKKFKTTVHRIIGLTFLKNDDNNLIEIDHIDRNRLNNNINNLRWVTRHQNSLNITTKNIVTRNTNGNIYYRVNYAISKYNYHYKHFKNEKDANDYLVELKIKYPRNI